MIDWVGPAITKVYVYLGRPTDVHASHARLCRPVYWMHATRMPYLASSLSLDGARLAQWWPALHKRRARGCGSLIPFREDVCIQSYSQ